MATSNNASKLKEIEETLVELKNTFIGNPSKVSKEIEKNIENQLTELQKQKEILFGLYSIRPTLNKVDKKLMISYKKALTNTLSKEGEKNALKRKRGIETTLEEPPTKRRKLG